LFTVPGAQWEVSAYGFFLGLALVVGWLLSISLAARDRLPADRLGTSYVVALGFALVGARAAWLFGNPAAWAGWGSLLTLAQGGLSPAAGLVVAVLVTIVHTNRMGVPTMLWLDAAAPALALGIALERTGALFAGIGFGRYAPDFPLAIRFPIDSPAFEAHRRGLAQLLPAGATESLPVYPTQIIALLLAFAGLALALRLRKRRRFAGQVALATLAWLLAARTLVEEPLRADRAEATIGPFAPGQVAAALLVLALLLVLRSRWRAASANPKAPRPWEGGAWSPKPPE
jgi:phosphatidylglycerol:prolipoprotein diacylglycerol transferase